MLERIYPLLENALYIIPPLLVAMVLHEVAHAYIAYRLGDPTAKNLNRLNLNPIVHIDPIWTLLVPGLLILSSSPFVFGAAKPVPVDPRYFKDPRRGMMWVAIAGPIINFILAIISALLFFLAILVVPEDFYLAKLIFTWLVYSVMINLVLGLFNLLPIPPLDGGRIMVGILPLKLAIKYAQIERFGFILVIALIYFKVPEMFLGPVLDWVQKMLFLIASNGIPA